MRNFPLTLRCASKALPTWIITPAMLTVATLLSAAPDATPAAADSPPPPAAAPASTSPAPAPAPVATPALTSALEFTPWLSLTELNEYFEKYDSSIVDGKNYWDRGHWLTAVEGRWENGGPQYRVKHGPVPSRRANWWFWYMNMDQASFDKQIHRLADEGFQLVHFNSYKRPGGSERFQGVWQRLVPVSNEAPLPPGQYELAEMYKKPVGEYSVQIQIGENAQLTGQGMLHQFSGSVKSRFSGTIKTTAVHAQNLGSAESNFASKERQLLDLLKDAFWKQDGEDLLVLETGRPVLRFKKVKPVSDTPATPKE